MLIGLPAKLPKVTTAMAFRVPEQYRVNLKHPNTNYVPVKGDNFGFFIVPRKNKKLKCIASGGDEITHWQHVSVSVMGNMKKALPNWTDMCAIKDLFWTLEDCVVQYHPPRSTYVDLNPVLHLWRPDGQEFPMPPIILV